MGTISELLSNIELLSSDRLLNCHLIRPSCCGKAVIFCMSVRIDDGGIFGTLTPHQTLSKYSGCSIRPITITNNPISGLLLSLLVVFQLVKE